MNTLLYRGAVILCLLLGVSDAWSESREQYGKTFLGSVYEEPWHVDPLQARTSSDVKLSKLLFDTLYIERDGEILPSLASSMPLVLEDGVVRIPIRPQVVFHDGRQLSSEDVAASIRRVAKSTEMGWYLQHVSRIWTETGAVLLELSTVDADIAQRLSQVQTAITPRGQRPRWRGLVGTGPFRLVSRNSRLKKVVLGAFDGYFAGRPYVDRLELHWYEDDGREARLYERGQTHASLRGAVAFSGHLPKYETNVLQGFDASLSFVGFGRLHKDIGGNAKFRQLVSLAIGRKGMALAGPGERRVPTVGVQPRDGVLVSSEQSANLSGARQLVKEIPKLQDGGVVLKLIVNKSRPDDMITAGKIVAALLPLGIRVTVVPLGGAAFYRSQPKQFDLYVGQWQSQFALVEEERLAILARMGYATAARSLANRAPEEIQREFFRTMPIVPLFYRVFRLHYRSDIKGVGRVFRFPDVFFFGEPMRNP